MLEGLEARLVFAKSKLLLNIDPEEAEEFNLLACEMIENVGYNNPNIVPGNLISDSFELHMAFLEGQHEATKNEIKQNGLTILLENGKDYAGYEWDGADVNHIVNSSLFDIDELITFTETIPKELVSIVRSETSEARDENCLNTETVFISIIAVDKSNVALVRYTTLNNYTDAEWSKFKTMSLAEAIKEISAVH